MHLLLLLHLGLEHVPQICLQVYCATLVLSYCFRLSHFRHQSVSSSVQPERPLVSSIERWNYVGKRHGRQFLPKMQTSMLHFRNLLHTANLQHRTDGFTSPPKEGVLRILLSLKIERLQPGLKAQTWVPKASTKGAPMRLTVDNVLRWQMVTKLYNV